MSDDDEDEFYGLYSYIPDEQTIETQEMSLGNNVKPIPIEEFCSKYFIQPNM
jgi:hypothetical protein